MLVIHIGPRKTGTTYLQNNFYRNRAALLRAGWLYPQVALRVQSAHHEIVSARAQFLAGKGVMVDRLMRATRKAAAKGAHMLLSSEGFRKWTAGDLRKLGDMTGHEKVVIVYTLRDPVSRLPSLWGENVKNGRRQSLPDFVAKAMAAPMKSESLNPLLELQPIIDHPGLELIVLDSVAIRQRGEDLYTAFCHEALGLDGFTPARDRPANSSFSVEINEYLRLLARHIDFDPNDKDKVMMLARQVQYSHGAGELAAIEDLIRQKGASARSVLSIDRNDAWFVELEKTIQAALDPFLRPPRKDDALFTRGIAEMAHYDIDQLANLPDIVRQLDRSATLLREKKPLWKRTKAQELWRRFKRLFVI